MPLRIVPLRGQDRVVRPGQLAVWSGGMVLASGARGTSVGRPACSGLAVVRLDGNDPGSVSERGACALERTLRPAIAATSAVACSAARVGCERLTVESLRAV